MRNCINFLFIFGSLCLMSLTGIVYPSQLPAQPVYQAGDKYPTLLKQASLNDRGIAHLNKGKMKLTGIENFGMIGRSRYYPPDVPYDLYSRHGHWGDLRWVLLYVAIPPGQWGANVVTDYIGIVDRSNQYNVVESFGWLLGASYMGGRPDWEAADFSSERLMGDAADATGIRLIASSDNQRSWPEGFFDANDTWVTTPGQRHWPGPWAVDNNPASHTYGQEVYGQFVSDRDMFFIMNDKYNGITANNEADVGYPVGLDVHVTGYSYEHPVYEDIVFMKYDIIYRDDIASSDPDRQFYAGPIDSIYVGFLLDPNLPGSDPQGNQASPWAIDDFAVIDKDEGMIMMFDKRGYTEDLGSPYSQGPVSVYSLALLKLPQSLGVTDYHFIDQDFGITGIDIGPHFEEVWYGVVSSKPELMENEREKNLYFHADINDSDYPHFDNIDSLIYYNEFDLWGNPFPTIYEGMGLRPDFWFSISSGPFVLTPGETYPLHIAIFGSEDNPGELDPNNFDIPVNTFDLHDRFADVYKNLNTAQNLYETNFAGHLVRLLNLNNGETVSGLVEILWDVTPATGDSIRFVDILYSSAGGASWDTAAIGLPNTGSYTWNTGDVTDGIHYRIRIIAGDSVLIGQAISKEDFVINNPGGVPPQIALLSPAIEVTVKQTLELRWHAGDADGDQVAVTIEYSPDDSITWQTVAYKMNNTGQFIWETASYPNSPVGRLRLIASDGTFADTVHTSYKVKIENERTVLIDRLLSHAGFSNETAYINIVDESKMKRRDYEATFDDTSGTVTSYSVRDLYLDSLIVRNEPMYDLIEGALFDGVRLIFDLHSELKQYRSDWSAKSDMNWWSIEPLKGLAEPRPGYYELRYIGAAADSSFDGRKKTPKLLPFQIWNMSYLPEPFQVIMQLSGNPREPWESDQWITFYEPDPANPGKIVKTWLTVISWPDSGDIVSIDMTVSPWDTLYATPTPPEPGDVYYWETTIPFTYMDTLRFSLDLTPVEAETDVIPANYGLAQNYPNPFNSSTAIEFTIPKASDVKIIIYDVLGREVKVLAKTEYPAGRHLVSWNGRNASGIQVASGVYIYRMVAGNFFKSQKMIVLR